MNRATIQSHHDRYFAKPAEPNAIGRTESLTLFGDAGRLVLRLVVGGLLLLHGLAKARGGLAPVMEALTHAGLPTWVAYGAYLGEIVAPLFLIAGAWTRLAALVAVCHMTVAIALVHTGDLFRLAPTGGWALGMTLQ